MVSNLTIDIEAKLKEEKRIYENLENELNELKSKYFVQPSDALPPTEPMPISFTDSLITPLIDAREFNQEVEAALNIVGTGPDEASNQNHYILIQVNLKKLLLMV